MRYFALIALLFAVPAFASNTANTYQWFIDIADRIDTFFEYTPSFIERMYSYILQYAIKLKFLAMLESMRFAYGVAQELLNDLAVYQFIDAAFSSLDPDVRNTASAYGVGSAIMRLTEAMTTRFVMDFMGA